MAGAWYTLGYSQPGATATLRALIAGDPITLLVDSGYSPRFRWSPQWSQQALQAARGDRYRHVKALRNVNDRLPDAPTQLLDAQAGIFYLVAPSPVAPTPWLGPGRWSGGSWAIGVALIV